MQNIERMKRLQSHNCLGKYTPYFSLLKELSFLFMIYYLLIEVTIICKLHYDAG